MNSSSGRPLFVYGTLMFPEIIGSLLGRVPESRPAIARGFEVRRIHGVSYPGMVAVEGGSAHGLLLDDLDDHELGVLDEYEDDFYRRVGLVVHDDGGACQAMSYVVGGDVVMAIEWTPRWFESVHLSDFVGTL